MKKLFLILFCMAIATLSAQNVDGGATEIMQKLAQKYQAMSTMQIDYTYKSEKDKKVTTALTGKACIKGNKYYLSFDNQYFYCDGETMWNYQKSTNEVSVYNYEESDDDLINPAALLKNWQKDYTAKFIREEVDRGKTIQLIDMTPKKGHFYYKIRMFIDKNKREIVRIAIYEKDNTIMSYYFDKFVANVSLSDALFKFDQTKYPGVEINDMR